ncbi:hypothetical protein FJZ53_03560 [Candidatus Woesearchaeota archaeon]|nr:hypothetical protein [Candidatus Woesearchaeota archaeon]
MGIFKKIENKTRKGLAVLVAGAMLGLGGAAYAKVIKQEGWPLPDSSKYSKIDEYPREFYCEYGNGEVTVETNVEEYSDGKGNEYATYSFEGKVFLCTVFTRGEGRSYNLDLLVDRDGNGSLETKYELTGDKDFEEYNAERFPEWVLKKAAEKQV